MSKYIEKVIYINLDNRTDRRKEIEHELSVFSIPFQRFPAIKTAVGCVGCTQSHLQILKNAKQNNYKNVLILEDDFMFVVTREKMEKNLTELFEKTGGDFDVCMLSYNLIKGNVSTDFPFLTNVQDAQTASGYIVSARFYDKLIDILEASIPLLIMTSAHWLYTVDQAWKPLQPDSKWYCFTERLGKQRKSFSDLAGCVMDYGC